MYLAVEKCTCDQIVMIGKVECVQGQKRDAIELVSPGSGTPHLENGIVPFAPGQEVRRQQNGGRLKLNKL